MTFGRINQLEYISVSWLLGGHYLDRIQRVHHAVLHYSRDRSRRHMGDNIWRREGFIIFKVHNTPKLTLVTNNQPLLLYYLTPRFIIIDVLYIRTRIFVFGRIAKSRNTRTFPQEKRRTTVFCFHCLQFTVLFYVTRFFLVRRRLILSIRRT